MANSGANDAVGNLQKRSARNMAVTLLSTPATATEAIAGDPPIGTDSVCDSWLVVKYP